MGGMSLSIHDFRTPAAKPSPAGMIGVHLASRLLGVSEWTTLLLWKWGALAGSMADGSKTLLLRADSVKAYRLKLRRAA
jgi:hypothetical protein